MADSPGDARGILLAAFAREDIDYPAAQLEEAVAEWNDLQEKIALIRAAGPSEADPALVPVSACGKRNLQDG